MIERYTHKEMAGIWTDAEKLAAWQQVELAVIEARARLEIIPKGYFKRIKTSLEEHPASIEWWKARERETSHDLQAWVEERVRHLPLSLRQYFHEGMTSFDTEETAFLMHLKRAFVHVFKGCVDLEDALKNLALKYRYCPMMAVTHGQYAEVQTFGKRCLTWYAEIKFAEEKIVREFEQLRYSKISGAIGSYGGLSPEVEAKALEILKFLPFHGATQILPRQIHASFAQSLTALVLVISKIGMDIRLGARSPRPIYQEPFGKNQTGSTAMPQKKNTISGEQLEGMGRMAMGYFDSIMRNIGTWEERSIEQSCVERVAWPDLFHVTMRALTVCTKVMNGLQVYPDHMMQDVADTHGTWAGGAAKEFLRSKLVKFGITSEESYRIVQLASFSVSQPDGISAAVRANPPTSLVQADKYLNAFSEMGRDEGGLSIKNVIAGARLQVVPGQGITKAQVKKWNRALKKLFPPELPISPSLMLRISAPPPIYGEWDEIFSIQNRLKNEDHLYEHILAD